MNRQGEIGGFFEGYADRFDRIYDRQGESIVNGWLDRHLRASMAIRFERTFAALRPMERCSVLDIGCGSGRYLVRCLHEGASRVVGIDLSPAMLALARAALDDLGLFAARADLICGDFLTASFAAPFDYTIAMGLMDYIADAPAFLRKLKATIGRRAALSFPVHESIWRWQRRVRYRIRGCPVYFYRRDAIAEMLKGVGFRAWSIERIHRDYFVVVSV